MKTVIVALSSKYIHSALAPWYLKAACGEACGEVCIREHTVNENMDTVLASIYLQKPDVAAFSCYIWNISFVLKLAASLKKLMPKTIIVLGGPEVSYDAGDMLREHSFIDIILIGEGEDSFPQLIRHIAGNAANRLSGIETMDGLACRKESVITINEQTALPELESINSPYTDEMLLTLKNKIVYYEASRGCPFSCSYCLSSVSKGTRYFPMERVLAELDRLIAAGVGQIKFVDRTFNSHKKRALLIVKHIMEMDKLAFEKSEQGSGLHCNFHFEVGADLFDEEILQLMESAPKGLFQIEAGVQTVNEKALAAVCRKTNLGRLFGNLDRLIRSGNIHVHADLIAGLPYEDYHSFGNSFNELYFIKPHQLQLGFLKFLKGTILRRNSYDEGYRFNDFPPYEILSGECISYDEIIVLKGIAELVERYYNSGRFIFSLDFIIHECFEAPFLFYESFYYFQKKKGYTEINLGVRELYAVFDSFASGFMKDEAIAALREFLRLDFLASDSSGTLPGFMESRFSRGFNEKCIDYMRNTNHIALIMPEAKGIPFKQLHKKMHFEQLHLELEAPGGEKESMGDLPAAEKDVSLGQKDVSFGQKDVSLKYNPKSDMVFVFNYMSKDKVSGRYQFYKADI